MNKFKVGDVVVTNFHILPSDNNWVVLCGTEGIIIKVKDSDNLYKVNFKNKVVTVHHTMLNLKQESEVKMEYNWHEAMEMVTRDKTITMLSESYNGALFYSYGYMHPCITNKNGEGVTPSYDESLFKSKWTIVKTQTDWSKVAVDTKVVVWNNGQPDKFRHYFHKFEYGKVYAFFGGATSFSIDCGQNKSCSWDNAELFEEQERVK